jgi:Uma2 family endonuclease
MAGVGRQEAVMSPQIATVPAEYLSRALYPKVTVAKYHQMIAEGVFGDYEPIELLEGYLVTKIPHNNAHRTGVQWLAKRLHGLGLSVWVVANQLPITLADSEPEPDGYVIRGDDRTYLNRTPGPADIGLVIEVSDSSLQIDRVHKGRLYAGAGIPAYWVVNLVDRQVEVYTDPDAAANPPAYRTPTDYRPGDTVTIVLGGQPAGSIPVSDLIP